MSNIALNVIPEEVQKIAYTYGQDLLFDDVIRPLSAMSQGQYSSEIAALYGQAFQEITQPTAADRPPLDMLTAMVEKDPVCSQCVSTKAVRAAEYFGNYFHPKREVELFINTNFKTLPKSFKQTILKMFFSVILYGVALAEFTFKTKTTKTGTQWFLGNINVLNPSQVHSFKKQLNKSGKIEWIRYDNGNGQMVDIPYAKCLHIINNAGTAFDKRQVWGVGNGIAALPYYTLKKIILTQLSLAVKNNSTGLLHVRVPANAESILYDHKGVPLKNKDGKDVRVTKQVALTYQMKDIYKRDSVVTDDDVTINRIQIQNNTDIHFSTLSYLDRAIQQAFNIPSGIFDANGSGRSNIDIGLSQNFKSVFDSTIQSLVTTLKHEVISKIVRKLLYANFPATWGSSDWGEFRFEQNDDQNTINSRLSTITSLIASGIIDGNNTNVLNLIYKDLGLPPLEDEDKKKKEEAQLQADLSQDLQNQNELLQLQQQIQMLQYPPQTPTEESEAYGGEPPA